MLRQHKQYVHSTNLLSSIGIAAISRENCNRKKLRGPVLIRGETLYRDHSSDSRGDRLVAMAVVFDRVNRNPSESNNPVNWRHAVCYPPLTFVWRRGYHGSSPESHACRQSRG